MITPWKKRVLHLASEMIVEVWTYRYLPGEKVNLHYTMVRYLSLVNQSMGELIKVHARHLANIEAFIGTTDRANSHATLAYAPCVRWRALFRASPDLSVNQPYKFGWLTQCTLGPTFLTCRQNLTNLVTHRQTPTNMNLRTIVTPGHIHWSELLKLLLASFTDYKIAIDPYLEL